MLTAGTYQNVLTYLKCDDLLLFYSVKIQSQPSLQYHSH